MPGPCPHGLSQAKVSARAWRTRAELIVLLDRARLQLERDISAKLPIRELAQDLGLSQFHFIKVFGRTFGKSPAAYRSRVRLEVAKSRIRDGRSAAAVAAELQFSDLSAFNHFFKRGVGQSPSTFATSNNLLEHSHG